MCKRRLFITVAVLSLALSIPSFSCMLPGAQPASAPVPAVPVLVVKPDKLVFTVGPGQGPLLEQAVSVINQGGGIMNESMSDNSQWIVLQQATNQIGTQTVVAIVVVDATGMPPGSYTGIITVSADGALNSPIYVPVYLTILQGANIPPETEPAPVPSSTAPGQSAIVWSNQSDLYRYSSVNALVVNGSVTNTDKSWYLKDVKIVAAGTGDSVTVADQIPPGETVMYNRYIPSFQKQEVTLSYVWYRP
ncbi:MAG: hypothetical protein NTV42_00850 [Chloroflexi bacterium]|nr:hypothetical protein [Chloroflexota bacterium]